MDDVQAEDTDCKSLKDLMKEVTDLAFQLAYATIHPAGGYFHPRRGVTLPEAVWTWVDGLNHKYLSDRMTGHCSLADTINFDIGAFEEEVVADIAEFKRLLAVLPPPRQMTWQELKGEGYKVTDEQLKLDDPLTV